MQSRSCSRIFEVSRICIFKDRIGHRIKRLKHKPRIRINKSWGWKKRQMMKRKRLKNKNTNWELFLKKYNSRKHISSPISGSATKRPDLNNKTGKGNKVIIRVPRMYVTNKETPLDISDIKMLVADDNKTRQ